MKAYNVFIVAPEKDLGRNKVEPFEFPKLASINWLGNSLFHYDIRSMLLSHLVVTSGDWHECEKCSKAVQVARIMGITVIHETMYKAYVEQNYN